MSKQKAHADIYTTFPVVNCVAKTVLDQLHPDKFDGSFEPMNIVLHEVAANFSHMAPGSSSRDHMVKIQLNQFISDGYIIKITATSHDTLATVELHFGDVLRFTYNAYMRRHGGYRHMHAIAVADLDDADRQGHTFEYIGKEWAYPSFGLKTNRTDDWKRYALRYITMDACGFTMDDLGRNKVMTETRYVSPKGEVRNLLTMELEPGGLGYIRWMIKEDLRSKITAMVGCDIVIHSIAIDKYNITVKYSRSGTELELDALKDFDVGIFKVDAVEVPNGEIVDPYESLK